MNGYEVFIEGAPGEIVTRGPQAMKGYWPEPGSGPTKAGWLPTRDIAVMDEDGYFSIQNRVKDMINVSGLKVHATTVDEVLFKHPGMLMAAAVGVPDPKKPASERIMAFIWPTEAYGKADGRRDYCCLQGASPGVCCPEIC